MERALSPIERARQILKSIALEESNNLKNDESESPLPQSEEGSSGEGISVEGPPRNYEEDIHTRQPVSNTPIVEFNSQNIVQGFILSEILGKPISRRRGRW